MVYFCGVVRVTQDIDIDDDKTDSKIMTKEYNESRIRAASEKVNGSTLSASDDS